ncbi:MAG: NAD(P)/FAD-dependent oxidoreductase [Thermoplasmataceae archaeon]
MLYDVIVVGGGPSGCAASRRSAELGLNTLMVDGKIEIGSPLRDYEILSRNGLERMGVETEKHWMGRSLREIRIFVDEVNASIILDDMEFYSVEMDKFEKHLAALSSEAGADIKIKTEAIAPVLDSGSITGVKLRTGQTVSDEKCRAVIFAGGLDSAFMRNIPDLGIPRGERVARSLQYRVVGNFENHNSIDIYPGADMRSLYAVIPKEDNIANIVALGLDDDFDPVQSISAFINNTLNVSSWGSLQEVSAEINRTDYPEKLGMPGMLVAGDSTGMNSGCWAMGVENAYVSGMIAADTLNQMLVSGTFDLITEYERKIRELSKGANKNGFMDIIAGLNGRTLKNRLKSGSSFHFRGKGNFSDILGSIL